MDLETEVDEIADGRVDQRLGGAGADHQQARALARLGRAQRDGFGREFEIEEVDTHGGGS